MSDSDGPSAASADRNRLVHARQVNFGKHATKTPAAVSLDSSQVRRKQPPR